MTGEKKGFVALLQKHIGNEQQLYRLYCIIHQNGEFYNFTRTKSPLISRIFEKNRSRVRRLDVFLKHLVS